ncbi:hypothetical protein KTD33_30215 [Burkholderia gladioli]|uniref:DUF2570 domain-containing protein n=1 Tax=Burkholderia gladioli TaxID=28095 RepID=A0AAW3FCM8_BURGA|nr:hypothetical protein [Burkholderia gladioli]KGC20241.1 hypothetical protein DM48_7890 [Burkholderia gladioli]MBU9198803.1 hypothetical protein [Burkholderia gladioli]
MKPSLFQALVLALLLLLLALVTTLVVEVTPMRKELHVLAAGQQADADAGLKADAAAQTRTQQFLDRASEALRKEQAPAPAFHIIPDH